MFNIGAKEILVLAVVIMILFGSKKLTELARGLGQSGKELKKAKKEFTQALGQVEETAEDVKKSLK